MVKIHGNNREPQITELFLANGGRKGLYRSDLDELGFHRSTITRWIRKMEDAGKVERKRDGRNTFVRWIGES